MFRTLKKVASIPYWKLTSDFNKPSYKILPMILMFGLSFSLAKPLMSQTDNTREADVKYPSPNPQTPAELIQGAWNVKEIKTINSVSEFKSDKAIMILSSMKGLSISTGKMIVLDKNGSQSEYSYVLKSSGLGKVVTNMEGIMVELDVIQVSGTELILNCSKYNSEYILIK